MGYADLHSHVLPGLDDGAADVPDSVAMIRGLVSVGFDVICATPHQKAAQFLPDIKDIQLAYQAARERHPALDLRLAAENYWDEVFFARSQDSSFPRYDQGRAFLFEIPPEALPPRFEESVFRLAGKGLLPVLAHPERYVPLWSDVDRLARLGGQAALVVDLGAVAGYHGWRVGRMARRMLADRIAHAAASDVHTSGDVRAAAEGIAWIKKKLGSAAEKRLLDENPRRILQGELPEP